MAESFPEVIYARSNTEYLIERAEASVLMSLRMTQCPARSNRHCIRRSPMIGDTGAGSVIFGVVIVLLLLVALYNINVDEMLGERGRLLTQSRRRLRFGWVLATAARDWGVS